MNEQLWSKVVTMYVQYVCRSLDRDNGMGSTGVSSMEYPQAINKVSLLIVSGFWALASMHKVGYLHSSALLLTHPAPAPTPATGPTASNTNRTR